MKNYKTIEIILFVLFLLIELINHNSERQISWKKNLKKKEKSPYGLFVFNKESKTLFKNKIKSIEKSPYAFYEKKENLKPHNILIIESELDALYWK